MADFSNKFVRISGHNGSTAGGTGLVFNSTYVANALIFNTPGTLQLSSSSAADTAAGTGARTATISGFDVEGAVIEETLVLNGQTAVVSTKEFDCISNVRVVTAGSGGVNAGNIFLSPGGTAVTAGVPNGATIISMIEISQGTANQFFFKVPRRHVVSVNAGALGDEDLEYQVRVRRPGEAWNTVVRVPNNTGLSPTGQFVSGTVIVSGYIDAGSANVIYATLDLTVLRS